MVVRLPGLDGEVDRHSGVEMIHVPGGEVSTGAEDDPVVAGLEVVRAEVRNPPVVIGAGRDDLFGAGVESDFESRVRGR